MCGSESLLNSTENNGNITLNINFIYIINLTQNISMYGYVIYKMIALSSFQEQISKWGCIYIYKTFLCNTFLYNAITINLDTIFIFFLF